MSSRALVAVYGFKMWSRSQARYLVSKFKAPREVIARYEVILMEGTEEAVPLADLDSRGRYRNAEPDSSDSAWHSSSMDLMNGLDVIEDPPEVQPRRLNR